MIKALNKQNYIKIKRKLNQLNISVMKVNNK